MNTELTSQLRDFLDEDLGSGDITSEAIFLPDQQGVANFVAKEAFVTAGIGNIVPKVFGVRNPEIVCTAFKKDGETTEPGETIFIARGPVLELLAAERLALNLAQRLSGIATLTAAFVKQVEGLPVKIVDTRKTTPGLRVLEKYAVRAGGGHNHRFGLADGILIKDNHIAAAGSISAAVARVGKRAPHTLKIEVECENLSQVEECLACGVEIIMLDNMDITMMGRAVAIIAKRALVEASGGVTLKNVRAIAQTGVDLISVGALTHSARAMDISMRLTSD